MILDGISISLQECCQQNLCHNEGRGLSIRLALRRHLYYKTQTQTHKEIDFL